MDIASDFLDVSKQVVWFAAGQTMVLVFSITKREIADAIRPYAVVASVICVLFNLMVYVPLMIMSGLWAIGASNLHAEGDLQTINVWKLLGLRVGILAAFLALTCGVLLSLRLPPRTPGNEG
ncbi:MAG: hypothetical protein AAFV77_08795 [Planctomycetota bacterium]